MDEGGFDGVIPVVSFSFPPQRAFRLIGGKMEVVGSVAFEMRSQDLEERYHDCGQFYWCDVVSFLNTGELVCSAMAAYVVSEMEAQDIDNESDWKIAEIKYGFMRRNHGC